MILVWRSRANTWAQGTKGSQSWKWIFPLQGIRGNGNTLGNEQERGTGEHRAIRGKHEEDGKKENWGMGGKSGILLEIMAQTGNMDDIGKWENIWGKRDGYGKHDTENIGKKWKIMWSKRKMSNTWDVGNMGKRNDSSDGQREILLMLGIWENEAREQEIFEILGI